MLLPRRVDGLLAAGRAANVEVASRLRARWMVMLTGAIAGAAAALAATNGVSPRALDPHTLQQALLDDGFYLGDAWPAGRVRAVIGQPVSRKRAIGSSPRALRPHFVRRSNFSVTRSIFMSTIPMAHRKVRHCPLFWNRATSPA